METYQLKKNEVKREWHLIDADGQVLGRLATEIARMLIGKDKVSFTPHVDGGDYVVVTNASLIRVTGKKMADKSYYHHTGYIGGLKEINLADLLARKPAKVIEFAVKNMLPKNKLKKERMKRLKVFAGSQHPYRDKFEKGKSAKNKKQS